jgi:3-phosphoshikimate 1-carboxyvinyltransferase
LDAYLHIFDEQGIRYARPYEANLPLTVAGALRSGSFRLDGRVSSQFVTGLLYALPLLDGNSVIEVIGGFESRGYVDLTIDMLRRFSVEAQAEGDTFAVHGGQTYQPQRLAVEGDWSQAAFFLVAGAVSDSVRVEGLEARSLQPDSAVKDILTRMGADIVWDGDVLVSHPAALRGAEIDVSQCPDLVPPLAVAAAFAQGTTHITGAARLRIKESDRLHALAHNLLALGVLAEEEPDGLVIRGGDILGGEVDSFGDHRIAMAFSVAAAASRQGVAIRGAHCVDKSYPKFYEDFASLRGNIT